MKLEGKNTIHYYQAGPREEYPCYPQHKGNMTERWNLP